MKSWTPSLSRRQVALLLLTALVALGAVFITATTGKVEKTSYYAVQMDAAARMQACMDAVKGYKQDLGIPLSPEDSHETGMIGETFNLLTTTLGDIGAKRTTANPDMAALVVKMLHEADLEPGDAVAAGFSGSFPALNLAVLCACDAMNIDIFYIVSIGSSVYGANNPELTFPEMACALYADGLISTLPLCYSIGGDYDIGLEMEQGLLAETLARLEETLPIPLFYEPDYETNIQRRMDLYAAQGQFGAFIAVGGNTTSLGRTEGATSLGQGLITPRFNHRILRDSGLVERYSAAGLPVINLLNIKKLVADYGLVFDPPILPDPGESAAYYVASYSRFWSLGGMGAVAILMFVFWQRTVVCRQRHR